MDKRISEGKKVRISYVDWWNGFEYKDYIIHNIISKNFNIEITNENPDYIFCSVYSDNHINMSGTKIFYTGENICPDFNLEDYAIGFEYLNFGDRYIRVPNWIMNPVYEDDIKNMLYKHKNQKPDCLRREFCCFVYSNDGASEVRKLFFEKLSKYKKVNSGGKYLNNIGCPEGVNNKLDFQRKHKFAIAFENSCHPGYTTEKIVQAFSAGLIPIYWGDPRVDEVFNKKAFIDVSKFKTLDEAIERVIEIDNNDEMYMQMLKEPAIVNENIIMETYQVLEKFIVNILEQTPEKAHRCSEGQWILKHIEKYRYQDKKRLYYYVKKLRRKVNEVVNRQVFGNEKV